MKSIVQNKQLKKDSSAILLIYHDFISTNVTGHYNFATIIYEIRYWKRHFIWKPLCYRLCVYNYIVVHN